MICIESSDYIVGTHIYVLLIPPPGLTDHGGQHDVGGSNVGGPLGRGKVTKVKAIINFCHKHPVINY